MSERFQLVAPYQPAGEQPQAIERLVAGFEAGLAHQTLLGVTGSGKTYTIANVIEAVQKPTLVLAPNKTLAAQLYGEFKSFFPHNAVEYFVSYYDYYQPEAYIPSTDTFIEKDSNINEHIEQMRLSATKALLERRDAIVVASVSAIYGLGDPNEYFRMVLHLVKGDRIDQRELIRRLTEMQYKRNDTELVRGAFRVRGEVIDVHPAESEIEALRIELFDGEIENLALFDPLTGHISRKLQRFTLYPKSHYVTTRRTVLDAIETIKVEFTERMDQLYKANKLLEAQRLQQRTMYDIEMMAEVGFCSGIEHYSRHLTGQMPGEPPPCLFDYLPPDALLVVDESHVTIPQLGAMYKGDRSRKETLVEFGFRLPSALDNRPLKFEEWERRSPRAIFVSATPGKYEIEKSGDQVVELVVRPTGLIDPEVEIRPVATQVDDVLSEIHARVKLGDRVLITTLTKKMAENLTDYLAEHDVRVRYLHSDVDTVERVEIIRGGLDSVHQTQWDTAAAMNSSRLQTLRHVVLPQAWKVVLPPAFAFFVMFIKDTALTSQVGVLELTQAAKYYNNLGYSAILSFGTVLILYFVLSYPMTRLGWWLEARLKDRRRDDGDEFGIGVTPYELRRT